MSFISLLVAGILGIALGYGLRVLYALSKKGSLDLELKQKILETELRATEILKHAEEEAGAIRREAEKTARDHEERMTRADERISKKEEQLDRRDQELRADTEELKKRIEEVRTLKTNQEELSLKHQKALESVALLSPSEARDMIIRRTEEHMAEDLMVRIAKLDHVHEEELEKRAKNILATTIQRLAMKMTHELTTTTVTLPSEDIKGKIIGKEGRNIRAFERAAGVDLLVDEGPGMIVVSSFDPIRRHVARVALERLIKDGRIQPARIEEIIAQVALETQKEMEEAGRKAIHECNIKNIDPRILALLGRLRFRTSYGQNVLEHSIEMAHIANILAHELGADPLIARTGALLHDIGKAVDHEIEGTHVDIGRKILNKFGSDNGVIQAMQSHHEEYPYETLESVIVQTADAISGGRPGARHDTADRYIKRLAELESIALRFPGVEKSFALEAGREIRIFVNPERMNDLEARTLARNIALAIEQELRYPGEIRVHVIRETRVLAYAR